METEDQLKQKEKEKQKVSRYKVSYRGVSQGLQKLYIPGSDGESRNILYVLRIREYGHSQYPFTMTLSLYRNPKVPKVLSQIKNYIQGLLTTTRT